MFKIINKIRNYTVATVMLLGMSSANAALVDITLTGDIESADAGNIFGLVIGDTITATGQIDDSLLAGGIYGSITNLQIFVGSQTFDDTMEAFGGSEIRLNGDGTLNDFTYEANEGALGASADFDSFFTSFTGLNTSTTKVKGSYPTYEIAGHWTDINIAAVPVPAAVWLFGSGLIGLVGLARRKTA